MFLPDNEVSAFIENFPMRRQQENPTEIMKKLSDILIARITAGVAVGEVR